MGDMPLNQVLKRVRILIEKAEAPIHEGNTEAQREAILIEQESARKMADALMMQYAVDEAMLDKSRPVSQQSKPSSIEVALIKDGSLLGYMADLAAYVARHCNCLIRVYRRYDYAENVWMSKVYGFESDLRYFEMLYTTLRLHMVGALRPHIDYGLSDEDNAYALHSAGLNWFDIAKMYGWREVTPEPGEQKYMYVNDKLGLRWGWSAAIQQYKRAYQRAVKARGEKELRVPPSGGDTFRRSSAQGYVRRINQRLSAIREGRNVGSALALRVDLVDQMFRQDNADLYVQVVTSDKPARAVRARKYVPPSFSQSAYEAGMKHADGAPLNPSAPNNPAREIS